MLPCCVVLIKILERETHFLGYLYLFSSSQISFEKFCTLRSLSVCNPEILEISKRLIT